MNDYSWIKVKQHKYNPDKSWEENYRDLERHHFQETTFLIDKIRELSEQSVCIEIAYPGLGDNLQFSTLPELFAKAGKKVYICNRSKFLNPEIKELVWDRNPYVAGFSDMKPNAGTVLESKYKKISRNHIKNWEITHGFEPTAGLPQVYYEPKYYPDGADVTAVDATCVSNAHTYDKKHLTWFILERFAGRKVMLVRNKNIQTVDFGDYSKFNCIEVNSIFQYCDVIASCKEFVCLLSGGQMLAQAVSKKPIHCIVHREMFRLHEEKGYFLNEDRVNYILYG